MLIEIRQIVKQVKSLFHRTAYVSDEDIGGQRKLGPPNSYVQCWPPSARTTLFTENVKGHHQTAFRFQWNHLSSTSCSDSFSTIEHVNAQLRDPSGDSMARDVACNNTNTRLAHSLADGRQVQKRMLQTMGPCGRSGTITPETWSSNCGRFH